MECVTLEALHLVHESRGGKHKASDKTLQRATLGHGTPTRALPLSYIPGQLSRLGSKSALHNKNEAKADSYTPHYRIQDERVAGSVINLHA